jgi:hypothetical protein
MSPPKHTLAETQRLFTAVLRGEPVPAADVDALVAPSRHLQPAERLAIYADMYLARLVAALDADFPMLARMVGCEDFHGLVADYVRMHPSEDPDLGQLGRHLAAFLRTHPILRRRADLADLAELEWLRSQVFCEAPREPLTWPSLLALGADGFAAAEVTLVPALRRTRQAFDLRPLWKALSEDAPVPAPLPSPVTLVVWRQGFDVFHAAVPDYEAEALEVAAGGATLGDVCGAFGSCDDPVPTAFSTLESWCADGWLTGLPAQAP